MKARLSLVVLSVAALAGAIRAQDPQQPTFRSGIQTVAIYATVLDEFGYIVTNLEQDDFEIRDEGKVQPITIFTKALQPITAIVMIDTSFSMTRSLSLAKAAAEQFLVRLLPGDRARVGSFSDRVMLMPAFTDDRNALLKYVQDGLHIGNPTRLYDAIDTAMTELEREQGRTILVVLTDGADTDSDAWGPDLQRRANANDIMVYPIMFPGDIAAEVKALPPTTWDFMRRHWRQFISYDARTEAQRVPNLSKLTGGGLVRLGRTSNVNAELAYILEELHSQYLLGFVPKVIDDKTHELEVRVKKPHFTVRARKSYLARAKVSQP